MTVEIRPLRPEEHQEAGEVTALAYRQQTEPASSNPDYLERTWRREPVTPSSSAPSRTDGCSVR
ncbi:MAG: hypothetical protein ACRDHH_01780 [Actinomycetota bacterium]